MGAAGGIQIAVNIAISSDSIGGGAARGPPRRLEEERQVASLCRWGQGPTGSVLSSDRAVDDSRAARAAGNAATQIDIRKLSGLV